MADSPRSATILLVDDDDGKRYSIAKILGRANYQTREATTGAEALQLAADLKPELVILDVKLPDMSGFEVCRRIKSDPVMATIPVLHISTTFVDIEDKVQGLEGGADGYLTDVLEPLELLATVNALLRARKAEEAAQLTAKQWQVTFDAIGDGVLLLDQDAKVVQINKSVERILSISWNHVVGKDVHGFLSIAENPDDSPFLRMLDSRRREAAEIRRGSRWISLAIDPIRTAEGTVKGALCIISDITDRRLMEEELRQRAEELAAADRRKNEFLAMLAHELRNPLAPIRNSLEEIQLNSAGDPAIEQAVDVAGRQVRHMSRLLEDLLDVSRITSGKVQLRKAPVQLGDIVAHALETSGPIIVSSQHQLVVHQPAEAIWVDGDATRLEQVLSNLLNNAAKYSEAGGRITLSVGREGDEVAIQVEDQGIGLSPEMLPRVFDLFSQADLSLDRSQGGLGIGLTLVHSLVELHGGTVVARSQGLGHGSQFVVRLPILTTAEPSARAEATPPPKPRASTKNLLLVDDHHDAAMSLARVLRLWGHKVTVAHDGPAALDAAAADRFDIVLLDIGLPGMDGYQVAEHLRDDPGVGPLTLVALTGYGQDDDQRRSRDAGFDVHLVKPVDLNDLRKLLERPSRPIDPDDTDAPLADSSPN
ncbi:response regulator [Singulisphaera sp. PoT]|uniref:hybrid sensor histidine kinase/response regulator n=1 Tax=Singulisphaera sp. PoT TaxID=3411797 RepID=UPI003BF55C4A